MGDMYAGNEYMAEDVYDDDLQFEPNSVNGSITSLPSYLPQHHVTITRGIQLNQAQLKHRSKGVHHFE